MLSTAEHGTDGGGMPMQPGLKSSPAAAAGLQCEVASQNLHHAYAQATQAAGHPSAARQVKLPGHMLHAPQHHGMLAVPCDAWRPHTPEQIQLSMHLGCMPNLPQQGQYLMIQAALHAAASQASGSCQETDLQQAARHQWGHVALHTPKASLAQLVPVSPAAAAAAAAETPERCKCWLVS